jgi:hypothetical protein
LSLDIARVSAALLFAEATISRGGRCEFPGLWLPERLLGWLVLGSVVFSSAWLLRSVWMFGMVRLGEGALVCELPFVSGTVRDSDDLGSEGCGVDGLPMPLRAGSTGPCSGSVVAFCGA